MESFKPILEKIKKIKQEKGYTNEVLAQKSGIPLSTLNKILSSVIIFCYQRSQNWYSYSYHRCFRC